MRPEPDRVAARLGFDETTIRRLQARGHLSRLALTEPEIRERLYHAHLADSLARAGGKRGGEGTSVSPPRPACALARRALAWASLAPRVASPACTQRRWWRHPWPGPLGSRTLRPRRAGLRAPRPRFRRIKAAPDAQAVPRVLLLTLVVLLAALLLPSARAAMRGQQRVLVVLATAEARPYTLDSVERALDETDAFFRRSSLGQTSLRTELVPWLTAYPSPPHCSGWDEESLHALVAPARAAATHAGYAPDRWDRVVYVLAGSDCGFQGVALGREAIITNTPRPSLLVHELGHTYGLAHAGASECPRCPITDQGDPFSPMGNGFVDFSAYEKHLLGWTSTPPQLTDDGSYPLARADRSSPLPHALIVGTGGGEYWLERRRQGLVIRLIDPHFAAPPLSPPTIALLNPTGAHRPWVAPGETFQAPGAFIATLDRDNVHFTWTDTTPPTPPQIHTPNLVGAALTRLRLTWTNAHDNGSGISHYTLSLDRTPSIRATAQAEATLPRPTAGAHTITVVAVDRAGNHSHPAIRHFHTD